MEEEVSEIDLSEEIREFVNREKRIKSHVRLFVSPWTVAYEVPPSMGFPRQEYWNGLPFPSPGNLPNPGIKAESPTL